MDRPKREQKSGASPEEALRNRAGFCQNFVHVMIACPRAGQGAQSLAQPMDVKPVAG